MIKGEFFWFSEPCSSLILEECTVTIFRVRCCNISKEWMFCLYGKLGGNSMTTWCRNPKEDQQLINNRHDNLKTTNDQKYLNRKYQV